MTKVIIKDDDDDVFDGRGILKDGATLTNRMYMKDGSQNPTLSPAQRVAAAVAATRAAIRALTAACIGPATVMPPPPAPPTVLYRHASEYTTVRWKRLTRIVIA
jgi:hypothetical protein